MANTLKTWIGVFLAVVLFGVALCLTITGARSWDSTDWQRIDDSCYVYIRTHRGFWPFHSDHPESRDIYCKQTVRYSGQP